MKTTSYNITRIGQFALRVSFLVEVICLAYGQASSQICGNWIQKNPPTNPSVRFNHSITYDSARSEVVLFGGCYNATETWTWDGTIWTKRSPASSPSERNAYGMTYDEARARVTLFGGSGCGAVQYLNDTWLWNGTNWSSVSPATRPPGRIHHSLAYDSTRAQVVLFGGSSSGGFLDDTWIWDGINWAQKSPSNKPPARNAHAMTYDPAHDKVVLFGGGGVSGVLGDTWLWNGTNWTQVFPAINPPARSTTGIAYDAERGNVVLFGGGVPGTDFQDTWLWDGANWTQDCPTNRPPGRSVRTLAYDSARREVVLFGGRSIGGVDRNDTWVLRVEGRSPPTLSDGLVAYYPFDGNPRDATGNGHDAVNYGAVPAPDRFGLPGRAYRFFGAERMVIPASPAFEVRSNITLAAWVRRATIDHFDPILCKDANQPDGSSHFEFAFQMNNALSFNYWAPGWQKSESSTLVTDTRWHHAAVTFNGQVVSLYIDGTDAGIFPHTVPLYPRNEPLQVGEAQAAGFLKLNGDLDDLRIYNRALSASDVYQLFNLNAPRLANLFGRVVELDSLGRARGPLAGASVEVIGLGARTTDPQGEFQFSGLSPGAITVTISKAGYHSVARTLSLGAGETKSETFQLSAQAAPGSTTPTAFDVASPNGKHLIEGMPGNLLFSSTVAWNGSPGSVRYKVAGTWQPAALTDLGGGMARATLSVAAPTAISACSELTVEVTNGEGQTRYVNGGVHFYTLPGAISKWYGNIVSWVPSGLTLEYIKERSWVVWSNAIPSGDYSSSASVGYQTELSFDPGAGSFKGSLGGFGAFSSKLNYSQVEYFGEGRLDLSGELMITLAGCDLPTITPSWTLSLSGKAGVGAPAVVAVDLVFPEAAPTVDFLLNVPVVKNVLSALKLRLFLFGEGNLSGEYASARLGDCFLGTTSLSGDVTIGIEGQAVATLFGAEAGVYARVTGTPEFRICPDLEFEGLTVRGNVGVFASAWLFKYSSPRLGVEVRFGPSAQQGLLRAAEVQRSDEVGGWRPIGDSSLRWGEANHLAASNPIHALRPASPGGGAGCMEEIVVENVTELASPSIFADASGTLLLFALQDPQKPWYAATDIGTVRRTTGGGLSAGRIVDDLAAEFSPRVVGVNSNWLLAAWTRVAGDVSGATNPVQVAPHLEMVTSWFGRNTGTWSAPAQLTTNAVVDRDPLPVVCGTTQGILWIQNEGEASIGDGKNGDRLLFARWSGTDWEPPQTLWAGTNGILGFSFVNDGAGEGHIVFAVDEDGNLDSREDRELHGLFTTGGVWQPPVRLTSNTVEDTLPTLVSPNGVPLCVWSASNTLVYTALNVWNPRPVFGAYTLANQAPALDGVTLPGGAAVAYAVQKPEGVDIVASFYDANIDQWSLPRQLTHDEDVESALSLASDGTNLVIAYLKTQTLRSNITVTINGQMYPVENVPQPGRTDLSLLCYALGNDLAVMPGSLIVDPPNPAPGSNVTLRATVENRGDRPLQNIQVAFYDGNPALGGTLIGMAQTIAGPFVGGATQQLSVVWTVPVGTSAHDVFVVVDPTLAVEDRDRANNTAFVRTVLPDLTIETCWSAEVSRTNVLLVARTVNIGVIPAGPCELSWRVAAANGEEIGRTVVNSMAAGQTNEVTFLWDTSGRYFTQPFVPVFAVLDAGGVVQEWNESNNDYAQTVRVVPGWVPRVTEVRVLGGTTTVLTFEADGYAASAFLVESTASLGTPISWGAEASAMVTTNALGRFEAQVPLQGGTRFYRVVAP